jgi:tyrosyl-tRNA synthetase
MIDFIEELKWRGMLHDMVPGTDVQLKKEMTTAYIGFDPTADSLHVGSFAQIMLLKRFQMAGHKPLVLIGGATGMIGDPSGKSQERNLLDEESLQRNLDGIKQQLMRFLDFENGPNNAEMVNNYDWMKEFSFLSFIRDVGKHITVNYMMSKDSVKKRLSSESKTGMSFTEFTYQLVQGYDFLWLNTHKNCKLQMGGSDQWGNITTGTELIRRTTSNESFALTIPLVTKSDGSKFGKSEGGNIWLDAEKTSPYKFYQFWLNVTDDDAAKYIRIFTMLGQEDVEKMIAEHQTAPHLRLLQKALAQEITVMVHSQEAYDAAVAASDILFGKGTQAELAQLSPATFADLFEGVPQFEVAKDLITNGVNLTDLLSVHTEIFSSKGECRKMADDSEATVSSVSLIRDQYILVRKGKKNYYLILVK